MLEGTISLRIDQDEPIQIAKPHCYTLGCGGTLEANGELIERLKHAQTIAMEAKNLTGQAISLPFRSPTSPRPLTGLAASRRRPTNPQELKEPQQQRADVLQAAPPMRELITSSSR